jgi:hypothetical protein
LRSPILLYALLGGALACKVTVGSATRTTKPAGGDATPTSATTKPVRDAPTETEDPAPDGPDDDDGGVASASDDLASPTTRVQAVCRMDDAQLAALCHRALDPIAADDKEAWLASLADDVVLLRPGPDGDLDRQQGARDVHRLMNAAGGVRSFVHADAATRIVGTLVNDCRTCAHAFVALTANTRSGALAITMDTATPPRVTRIELRSDAVQRTRAR